MRRFYLGEVDMCKWTCASILQVSQEQIVYIVVSWIPGISRSILE